MAQERSDLPQGTDKVVAGSSTAGGESRGSDVLVDTGADRSLVETARSGGSSDDATLTEKIRSGGEKLTGQAADKARDLVGQGLERSAEALTSVGRMIGDTADGIDERLGEEYGDYARRAAQAIEDTASNIASKDPEELIEDTRNFVRKSPGVALAGAAIVGFALARIIKSSLSSRDEDDTGRSGKGKRN